MSMLNMFKTLITGKAREFQHGVEDRNIDTILNEGYEQECASLIELKRQVAKLGGELTTQTKQRDLLKKNLDDAKAAARRYLEDDNEAAASKILDKIENELNPKLEGVESLVASLEANVSKARVMVDQKEADINRMKVEVEQVKTKAKVNKINASISTNGLNSDNKSTERKAAFERLKTRTEAEENNLDAAESMFGENNPDSLESLINDSKKSTSSMSAADRLANL